MAEEKKDAPAENGSEENKEQAQEAAKPEGPANAPATLRVILGRKLGMTQVFDAEGMVSPVTVVEAGPNPVLALRTKEKDGYEAVSLGFGKANPKKLTKPVKGQYAKSGQEPPKWSKEIRVPSLEGFEVGQAVTLEDRFAPGDYVDIQAVSKGGGFAGVMKRHNFGGLEASHGASDKERSPGSIASRRSLGRVLSGQRMAGHKGAEKTTVMKVEVVEVRTDKNQILLRGGVPGPAKSGLVTIKETTRPTKKKVVAKKASKKKGKK